MHPVLTAFAEDAVAAHSSATDSTWELAWTLQEIQPRTTDHDLCLSCIYSQPFLLHCFFPCQEPSDTFLQWFSYDDKVVSIEVLPWDPTAEFTWQGFKHNDKKQWAEYRALVNTNLHFKLFTVPLTNTYTAPGIGIHSLYQVHYPHQVSSVPTKWPSWALGQMLSQGLRKPCKVSCWPRYLVSWIQQTSTFLRDSVSTTSQTLPLRVFTLSVPTLNFLRCLLDSPQWPDPASQTWQEAKPETSPTELWCLLAPPNRVPVVVIDMIIWYNCFYGIVCPSWHPNSIL